MNIKYKSLGQESKEDMEENKCNSCRKASLSDDEHLNLKTNRPVSCTVIYKGLIYSAISSLFFSVTRVIVKHLRNVHPSQLSVARFVGIFLLSIPLVVNHGGDPLGPKELRFYLIFRGISGATNLFLRFYSMRHLPIGEAAVIVSTVPIFVSLFACVFLKESCGLFQTFAAILTMVGLSFIVKLPILLQYISHSSNPVIVSANITLTHSFNNAISHSAEIESAFSTERIHGLIAACSSVVFAAGVFVLIRKVKKTHFSVILFNFGWVALLESIAIAICLDGFSMPKTSQEWLLIVLVAVFGFCGQLCLTLSLQSEEAGPVSVARSALDVTLTMLWQLLFFAEIPDVWGVVGTILVVGSVVVIGLRKWFLKFPEESNIRRMLCV